MSAQKYRQTDVKILGSFWIFSRKEWAESFLRIFSSFQEYCRFLRYRL